MKSLFIFDPDNVSSIPILEPGGVGGSGVTFVDPAKVYHIQFTRNTSDLKIRSKDSDAGQYFTISFSGVLSHARLEVEVLIRRLMNHRVHAICTDNNDLQRYLWNVKFSADYETGRRKSDINGYTIKLDGVSDMALPILSGEVVTDTDGGDVVFNGGAGSGGCVSIYPIQLGYVPAATGNADHRCEFVLGSDGRRYFIDAVGQAICLNATPGDFEVTDSDNGFILKDPNGGRWRQVIDQYGIIDFVKL